MRSSPKKSNKTKQQTAKRDNGVTDRYLLPYTLIDDGVTVRYSIKVKDLKERLGPNYKDYLSTKPGPELLERDMATAERYLEYLSEHPESYGDGDKYAERELCGALMNLCVALGVGDRAIDKLVWAAATVGAQFGKKLEEMRGRLEGTDRAKQVNARKSGKSGGRKGGEERKRLAERGAQEYRKYFGVEKKKDPTATDHALCVRVATKYGAEVKSRFYCGASYKAVERAVFGKTEKTK